VIVFCRNLLEVKASAAVASLRAKTEINAIFPLNKKRANAAATRDQFVLDVY
jgi:hypothetical protein